MKIDCVIIDDEPLAVDVIETYVNQIGGMEIVAKCNNPLDAITILNKHQVDLVFLDIEMPNLTGLDLVKTVENIPQFIFTTAYPQHALEGFELNASENEIISSYPPPIINSIYPLNGLKKKLSESSLTSVISISFGFSRCFQC